MQSFKIKYTDDLKSVISAFPNMKRLDLSECRYLNNANCKEIGTLTDLRHLIIHHQMDITDAGVEHIKTLPHLEHLEISSCPSVTGASLQWDAPNLRHLNFSGNHYDLTDTHFERFSAPKLEHLNISDHSGITGTFLKKLDAPSLEHLNVGGTSVSDAHLKLDAFPNIRHLDTHLNPDLTLKELNITNLRHLNISNCRNVSNDLFQNRSAPNLEHLNISGSCNQIGDAGLQSFHAPALEYLNLTFNQNVTATGLKPLLLNAPNLRQLITDGCPGVTSIERPPLPF